ncbi:MAG: NAD(+) synthase [Christensenella sp.]
MKQRQILNDISPDFKRDNQTQEQYITEKREQTVDFIRRYMNAAQSGGVVLGVSGGVDSFLCAALCAEGCAKDNKRLHIVLLPNGVQSDIEDARACVRQIVNINPQTVCDTISIAGGYAGALADLKAAQDFNADALTLGNMQPRLRMLYQYALAKGMLVAGTDHATETIMGFYTKYGDGGSDFNPMQELVKDDIYAMSKTYGAPREVLEKQPAAGLGISETDEQEMGIAYADICAYLKGNIICDAAQKKLEAAYERSVHKRAMPASLKDEYTCRKPLTHIHIGAVEESRVVQSTLSYINAHPEQNAVYVMTDMLAPEFYTKIKKTINTPIKRYNCFEAEGDGGVNAVYGRLAHNIEQDVVVSGKVDENFERILLHLMNSRYQVTLLKDCLTKVKK